jgi:4a-hydroxytetrahydrobiopterin dehydratase
MMESLDIFNGHCKPCERSTPALDAETATGLVNSLAGWTLAGRKLEKTFVFRNHYAAMAFVNAIAWVSHREDHHPELTIGYKDCRVVYWTHAIGGLSENDFICAAKLEKLLVL